jgi:hypothetical protein
MMKSAFVVRLGLAVTLAVMILSGGTKACGAEENDRNRLEDRLNQLERHIQNLTEQQHQFMQHAGAMLQRLDIMPPPGAAMAHPAAMPGPMMHSTPPPMFPRCPLKGKCCGCPIFLVALFLLASVINILIAVWIYTDIRKRGEGPGIFIALALIAGIPTAIIYALVRIGDRKS